MRLNTQEAADRLGLSRFTLEQWRSRKVGPPYFKEVGLVYYVPEDLDAWRTSCRVVPGASVPAAEGVGA